ncbi:MULTISPECIES: hemolysin family protein [unclassified Thermosipho (in: thermotogales)]|uniref:hemolysin family protein n=1 Tax=unclassified Thermosipho (in: thermotogales) TaxID=2676525 RepID=UPI0009871349|nr:MULTISPECIES: hemolysin family protein [unclassified Thermosipho (in: thermotogales)]MBT1247393.1 hemolysin [Thermosipho sp. 1244]OOC46354.1 hemolysin [Thermosipho sp. 1223]
MEDPLSYFWSFIFLIFLLYLSSVFSASETALTSVSRLKLRESLRKGDMKEEENELHLFNKLLTVILIMNNLVNILASSVATLLVVGLFENILPSSISALLSTLVLTFFILIFGEITPKIYARQNNEKIFNKMIKVLLFLSKVFSPIIKMLVGISNFVIKLIGGKLVEEAPFITTEDILMYVEVGMEEGTLRHEESFMLKRTLEMEESMVKEIMIPRVDIIAIEESETLDKVMEIIKEEEYSRIPVYKETIDNIVGICYAKDVLVFISERGTDVSTKVKAKELMREPLFVPETMKVSELLKIFKEQKIHMAIVVDEYGGTAGLVTMEDILEEIFGEIMDEYDQNENIGIKRLENGAYIVDATVPINDLERELGVDFPETDYETLAGYILEHLQRIPKVGEEILIDGFSFKIIAASKNRIEKVLVKVVEKNE